MEADDDVGHLHAGVVDVVLNFDALAAGAKHAHEGVAERGIAQVPDVRCLVGIDVGVLDDDFLIGVLRRRRLGPHQAGAIGGAVEADIDVPVAGHFQGRHAGNRADLRRQFGGDLLGRLAQLLRQLESGGDGHLPKIALPRLLDIYREIDAVTNLYVRTEGARNLLFNGMKHGKLRV